MDLATYLVRPFTDRDYEASSRIWATVNPEFSFSADEERHWESLLNNPSYIHERWVVVERSSGEAVATAEMGHSPHMFHPQKLWVGIAVVPAHRGRGIGRSLASLIESEAAAHRISTLWATARADDARSVAFSRRYGFTEQRRAWVSTLDLQDASLTEPANHSAKLEAEGIRFSTLAEEGPDKDETRRRLYALVTEAARDIPRVGEYTPVSYAQFVKALASPSRLPEGSFLASVGDRYVGLSDLESTATHPDTMRVGLTATLREYRGKGVASELKRRALAFARASGVRYLRTVNDSLNAPIWAINQRFGFRVTFEWLNLERQLVGEADAPVASATP